MRWRCCSGNKIAFIIAVVAAALVLATAVGVDLFRGVQWR
jgi:hypothetical protein